MNLLTRRYANPFALFDGQFRDFDELFSSPFEKTFPIDLKENADNFEITADVPGCSAENIDVALENRTLTISTKFSKEKEEKESNYYIRERRSQSTSRSVYLSHDVDQDDVKTELRDGVLKLVLYKKSGKTKKKIEIISK